MSDSMDQNKTTSNNDNGALNASNEVNKKEEKPVPSDSSAKNLPSYLDLDSQTQENKVSSPDGTSNKDNFPPDVKKQDTQNQNTTKDYSSQTPNTSIASDQEPPIDLPQKTAGDTKTKNEEPMILSSVPGGRSGVSKKAVATFFGIVFLVGAILTGVFLVQRQQFGGTAAWDCQNYVFSISQDGVVSVRNGSSQNEPPQNAIVYINGVEASTFSVPSLESGDSAVIGTVEVPTTEGFSWRVTGDKDCEDEGTYEPLITGRCSEVVAYDTEWNVLSSDDLSALSPGDVIRFAVSGSASEGFFDMARFTINGVERDSTSNKVPGSDEFFDEYIVPDGVNSFSVSAQIHHSSLGWF